MSPAFRSSCRRLPAFLLRVLAATALLVGSALAQQPIVAPAAEPAPPADAPLATYRTDLLQRGFAAVSAMPTEPHRKNRARAQEAVVKACLQLDQVQLAEQFTRRIDDWRRGVCLADLAIHWLGKGQTALAVPLLAAADQVAEQAGNDPQAWRRDRVRARIGAAHLLLGDEKLARSYAAGAGAKDLVEFEATLARQSGPETFADQLAAVDAVVAAGQFDPICGALAICVELCDRYHADASRRDQLESRVLTAYAKLPPGVRLGLVLQLVASAVKHGDHAGAGRLLDRAEALLGTATFRAEDEIVELARMAAWRGKVGATERARKALVAATARYYESADRIVDIYRASVLRELAVAYARIGDPGESLRLFRATVEAGQQNPNSRPRAEDFAATCAAMAIEAIEPDATLLARLEQIQKGLGNPW